MSDFGELLKASTRDANLLVLFIPSADREGDTLGKKAQKRWVRKALKLLGQRFTGATAFPRGWGTWRDDAQGGRLVWDHPVLIQCFTSEAALREHAPALRVSARYGYGNQSRGGRVCARPGDVSNQLPVKTRSLTMAIDPQEFATMLGAEIVGEVPDVGGGPFGMARLAHIMHAHLTPSRGERPGRPTNPNWATRCKVPMSDATLQRLTELAAEMSTAERKVSPMQVAAQLLEEALGRVGVETAPIATKVSEGDAKAGERSPLKPTKLKQSRGDQAKDQRRKARRRKQA